MKMIDIHTHLLPYVDDGASCLEESLELLRCASEQGVVGVCLTPHYRDGMFTSSDEKVNEMFAMLRSAAHDEKIPVHLFLAREYFYSPEFVERLQAQPLMTLGSRKVLLTEFPYDVSWKALCEAAATIQEADYHPLFAHIERYHVIQNNPNFALSLKRQKVILQVNADSVLGLEGRTRYKAANRLLSLSVVHAIASDAHNLEQRKINLKKCSHHLEKKFGREYAKKLLADTPFAILK